MMQEWIANPLVQGTITGLVSAAMVDYAAFRSWKSWHDAAVYGWGTAAFRWFQGAVGGLLTALGLGAIS
jgi:hypothetical protein